MQRRNVSGRRQQASHLVNRVGGGLGEERLKAQLDQRDCELAASPPALKKSHDHRRQPSTTVEVKACTCVAPVRPLLHLCGSLQRMARSTGVLNCWQPAGMGRQLGAKENENSADSSPHWPWPQETGRQHQSKQKHDARSLRCRIPPRLRYLTTTTPLPLLSRLASPHQGG